MVDLSALKVADLLELHSFLGEELRLRGVAPSANNPTGDVAEHLFCKAFSWTQAGNSNAGFDALDDKGVRYQIKARRLTKRNSSKQLSAIRDLGSGLID